MRRFFWLLLVYILAACTLGQQKPADPKQPAPTSVSPTPSVPLIGPPTATTFLAPLPTPKPLNTPPPARVRLTAIPAARLAHLARGVNLTQWYKVKNPEPFSNYYTDNDLQTIRALGFTDVRLAVPVSVLFQPDQPAVPNPQLLAYLDAALNQVLANGLSVIVDMHVSGSPSLKDQIEQNDTVANGFVAFWSALAQHLSRYDPDRVYLEILNEPNYSQDPEQWIELQKKLVAAIRAEAPAHTLIATGPLLSDVDGLLKLTPVDDPNVIYTFHFYEPFPFTAQSATWVNDPAIPFLKNLPYPWSSTGCAAALAALANADAQKSAQKYCSGKWDAAKLQARLQLAADWSHKNNAQIFVGEFGALSKAAQPADRLQWFRDVYNIFQQDQISWTLWGYDDPLGLDRQLTPQGKISLDTDVVEALHLDGTRLK
jgi:endoglucanase